PLVGACGPDDREREETQFWVLWEYRDALLKEILAPVAPANRSLVLDTVMEALNMVLRHEPVLGISVENNREQGSGLVFETRTIGGKSASPHQRTTVINTALERLLETRWSYVTRLARGETSSFADIANALNDKPRVAQVQFSLTEHGTIAYVTCGSEYAPQKAGLMPDLRGDCDLHVFTMPN